MSQPPAYTPQHSFVADSATLANFPGQALDVEFQSVKATTDGIETNLALIQRDDGALANNVVTYDSLSASLQAAVTTVGATNPASASGVNYARTEVGAGLRTVASALSDRVSLLDFGAVADSTTTYNTASAGINSAALNNALATGKTVFIPYRANGYSFAANTISVSTGQSIVGESQVLLKCQSAASGYFLHLTGFEVVAAPIAIQNVKIDMFGSGASSTAIRFATNSLSPIAGVQLSEILFTNCVEAIGDEAHATNYVVDVKMYDIRCINTLGRQIYLRRSRGFMWLDTIRIDQAEAGQFTPVTWEGARFEDFIGLEINRIDMVGPVSTGVYQSAQTGLVLTGAGSGQASVWLNRVLVDNTSGNGITISNVNYLNANWIESFQNLGNQIQLINVARSELSNVFAYGAVGLTGAAAGANGVLVSGCSYLSAANIVSYFNTGQGVSVFNSTDSVYSNIQATNNGGWGFIESGTSNRNLLNGGVFDNNTSGSLTIAGAASQAINYTAAGSYVGAFVPWSVTSGGTGSATAAGARSNLGVSAAGADTTYAFRANNLSDLASAPTARTNLGVSATGADTTYAFRANNLSDLASATTARTNLGLTAAAIAAAGQLPATATNDSATAGNLGEYIESNIASGSAVSLVTATAKDLTSISLTAGDWDVDVNFNFTGGATTTVLYLIGALSSTLNTLDATVGRQVGVVYNNVAVFNLIPGAAVNQVIPPLRLSLASTTTIHAVAQASFGTSTLSVYGIIRARRAR